ncbi:MAG: SDR family NAD(P)-dependent oxidoreductase [Bacteroidetes bacterium]|uniref:SDR family NAD(P)-dependent oxidoreductase n=1 Tax=Candidatus Gallipaludibacter merdavium TaxID=2840839 RepID=A0A9D9HWD4_9BACT|nr:SDR family NAD(P)-dependent oxidoreductase [Candidatus Gallipaludibacter merdavium]
MIAIITGATSGFGRASAIRLARLGYDVIITGRRSERLAELTTEIENQLGRKVYPLCFDIRSREACEKAWESLPEEWREVDVLMNNAGLAACSEPIGVASLDDFDRMIDTNVKGLLYFSQQVIPVMMARKKGMIINLSSIAGVEVYPNGNVYCATKHAVSALTKAMRIDLLPYGIRVGSISPGAAETEFSLVRFKGDADKAKAVYKGMIPLNAEDIADIVEFMVTRPEHVMINDVLVTPSRQANTYVYNRE